MDKIRNAAIILLGMGEKCAGEILKNMDPREVQRIMDVINTIDNVSEQEVIKAINEFFKDSNNNTGIDFSSKEHIKKTMASTLGIKGLDIDGEPAKWIELLKNEPIDNLTEIMQDEHPQIITAIILILSHISNDKASALTKSLPKELQNQLIQRMTKIGPISTYAVDALAAFFEKQLENKDRYDVISVDGVEAAANIISYLDTDTEREIISELTTSNKQLAEKVQDKIFPFEKLIHLDKKSLQTLMSEVKNEDLVLALKGVDDYVKNILMKNISSKSAEILKDEMDTTGPVKLASVIEAQKRIIILAKKLSEEEKIILSTKHDPDVIF